MANTLRRSRLPAGATVVVLAWLTLVAAHDRLAAQSAPAAQAAASASDQDLDGPWPPPGVVTPSRDITLPRVVHQEKPKYTAEALRLAIEGTVRLSVVVEADGSVGTVRVARSLDAEHGLDAAAVDAARRWRFTPALKDGAPVRILVSIELTFSMGPPPMTWPDGFATDIGFSETAEPETAAAPGFQLTLVHPPTWRRRAGAEPAGRLLSLVNGAGRMKFLFIDRLDSPTARIVNPLTATDLKRLAATTAARQSSQAEILGLGQFQMASRLWVWLELWTPSESAPPEAREALSASLAGVHVWTFMSSVGSEMVTIGCVLVVAPSDDGPRRQQDARAAAAELSPILKSITIEQK